MLLMPVLMTVLMTVHVLMTVLMTVLTLAGACGEQPPQPSLQLTTE